MFEVEGEEPLPDFRQRQYENELSIIDISEQHIDQSIKKLNATQSQGPYIIHSNLLNETKSMIKKTLEENY